jgi:hypothetical protein
MNTNSEPQTVTVNAPVPFAGTPEEADANYRTHAFDPQYDRCIYCDCRPWGRVANYPCGAEVPRADFTQVVGEDAVTEQFARFALFASIKEAYAEPEPF